MPSPPISADSLRNIVNKYVVRGLAGAPVGAFGGLLAVPMSDDGGWGTVGGGAMLGALGGMALGRGQQAHVEHALRKAYTKVPEVASERAHVFVDKLRKQYPNAGLDDLVSAYGASRRNQERKLYDHLSGESLKAWTAPFPAMPSMENKGRQLRPARKQKTLPEVKEGAYKLGAASAAADLGFIVLAADQSKSNAKLLNTLAGGGSGLYVGHELRPLLAKLKGRGALGNLASTVSPYVGWGLGAAGGILGSTVG